MSFQKAQDLLKLAGMSASRHGGITVKEVAEAFSVNERTAQRMIAALKDVFPSISHQTDSQRRRRWKLRDTSMLGMQGLFTRDPCLQNSGEQKCDLAGCVVRFQII